jgi:dTDP-4-amino-4,6-dideoxygalactose transaminase
VTKDLTMEVLDKLVQSGIEARKYYEPLHNQSVIMQKSEVLGDVPITKDIYNRIMSLPLHDSMTEEEIYFITDTIVQVYEKYKS